MALAKVRRVGGSLVVTIPNEVAEQEGLRPGELVNIEVHKARKSFFGIDRAFVAATARTSQSKILTGDPHFKKFPEAIMI